MSKHIAITLTQKDGGVPRDMSKVADQARKKLQTFAWLWAVSSELRINNILASPQPRGPRKSQELQVLVSPVFYKVSGLNWERKIHSHMSPLQV